MSDDLILRFLWATWIVCALLFAACLGQLTAMKRQLNVHAERLEMLMQVKQNKAE
jgi:hypothetical protein